MCPYEIQWGTEVEHQEQSDAGIELSDEDKLRSARSPALNELETEPKTTREQGLFRINREKLSSDSNMRVAKKISILAAVLSGIFIASGVVGFFLQPQSAMPLVGAITVSAVLVFLTMGTVWGVIEIAESLGEFLFSEPIRKHMD